MRLAILFFVFMVPLVLYIPSAFAVFALLGAFVLAAGVDWLIHRISG